MVIADTKGRRHLPKSAGRNCLRTRIAIGISHRERSLSRRGMVSLCAHPGAWRNDGSGACHTGQCGPVDRLSAFHPAWWARL